jgi:cytochrome c oxidase subunit 2
MGNFLGLPVDASAHGPKIDNMIGVVHWLMFILFVGWGLFFLYTLVRFRKSRQPKADYAGVKSHASSYLEVAVAIFEGVLLIGFAIPLWSTVVNAFPAENDATVVRIVAEQFAWNIHYPGPDGVFGRTDINLISAENPLGLDRSDPAAKDDIMTINQLNLPVNKPVIIHLTTKDVIHSLNLPLFRVKQDAIPGKSIPIWFQPTKTTAEIAESLTKAYRIDGKYPMELEHLSSKADYNAKDGTPIVSKGSPITEDLIPQLLAAGVTEVVAGPDTPTEIACAQLCGLGHFRMRGFVTIQTADEFKAWLAEQASYLTQ